MFAVAFNSLIPIPGNYYCCICVWKQYTLDVIQMEFNGPFLLAEFPLSMELEGEVDSPSYSLSFLQNLLNGITESFRELK